MELKLENLSKSYGKKRALNHFSATLTSGIYGLRTQRRRQKHHDEDHYGELIPR